MLVGTVSADKPTSCDLPQCCPLFFYSRPFTQCNTLSLDHWNPPYKPGVDLGYAQRKPNQESETYGNPPCGAPLPCLNLQTTQKKKGGGLHQFSGRSPIFHQPQNMLERSPMFHQPHILFGRSLISPHQDFGGLPPFRGSEGPWHTASPALGASGARPGPTGSPGPRRPSARCLSTPKPRRMKPPGGWGGAGWEGGGRCCGRSIVPHVLKK